MTTNNEILKRLLSESPVAYHPMLAHACGGATVALFLSQLLYWTGKSKLANGWFWKSATELQKETGLTRNEQETARKKLVTFGIIETKLQGVPATMHFRIDFDRLCERLGQFGENSQSSLAKSDKLVSGFSPNLIGEKQQTIHRLPETTTENTQLDEAANDAAQLSTLPGLEAPAPKDKTPQELIIAVATVAKVNLSLATTPQKAQVTQTAKLLHQRVKADGSQVAAFAAWWYANDWRGKKGQPPTPAQIRENWQAYQESQAKSPVAYGMRVVQM